MKTPFSLLMALALMGSTAGYNTPQGFQNELSMMARAMMSERNRSGRVQATNMEFMSPESRIQESSIIRHCMYIQMLTHVHAFIA